MLKMENIDINDQEGIGFLRRSFVEYYNKVNDHLLASSRDMKKSINELNGNLDRLDPNRMEKSRTIISNILFFIGSIFKPEITPSEWFGKQKVNADEIKRLESTKNAASGLISVYSRCIKGYGYMVDAFNKLLTSIQASDDALIKFIYAVDKALNENKYTIDWFCFFHALTELGYLDYDDFYEYMKVMIPGGMDFQDGYPSICQKYLDMYKRGK